MTPLRVVELRFGESPEQVADLRVPPGVDRPPVVVLWHGGSYLAEHTRAMMEPAAEALTTAGIATLNTTYRREGSGGGWPETFDDARAALAVLGEAPVELDLDDLRLVGFSAGTPLAVHAAAHPPPGMRVTRLVNLAGVTLVEAAAREHGFYVDFLGDPDERPQAYAAADPIALLPLGLPHLSVHGRDDADVPLALSECFVSAAQALGDDARLEVVEGAAHFDLHEPLSRGWPVVEAFLAV